MPTKPITDSIGKFLIGLVLWSLSATTGGIWWASSVSAELGHLRETAETASDDRYRGRDAMRDFALRDERIRNNTELIGREIKNLQDSTTRIEKKLDRILSKREEGEP